MLFESKAITKIINHLDFNLEFFNAPFANGEKFQEWAGKNKSDIQSLSEALKWALPGGDDVVNFANALAGKPFEMDPACLLNGDRAPICRILQSNSDLRHAILNHINDSVIDKWYQEQATQGQNERRENKLLDQLYQECEIYQNHLLKEIKDLRKRLPENSIHDQDDNHDFESITNNDNSHSSKNVQKLQATVVKYTKVQDLVTIIKNNELSSRKRIKHFKTLFESDDTKYAISQHRDSAGLRFLKNIAHILTFGIIAKLTKGTFAFWKSHGEVALESMEKSIDTLFKTTPAR